MSKRDLLATCSLGVILVSVFVWSCDYIGTNSPVQTYSSLHRSIIPTSINIQDSFTEQKNSGENIAASAIAAKAAGLIAAGSILDIRNLANSIERPLDNIRPRVLCWILTGISQGNRLKASAVNSTWGQRCDKFMAVRGGRKYKEQNGILTVPLMRESRDELWHKVAETFSYIRQKYLNQYDWFMKADDDTYVFVDTLKRFLREKDPDRPIYYGHRFRPYVKQGYMSGGAGYVLSREALRRLIDEGFSKGEDSCHQKSGIVEDVEMGRCLESVGVEAGDTRDESERPTFNALNPGHLLSMKNDPSSWYISYDFYGHVGAGKNCCSTDPISFHYVNPMQMRIIDWLVYDVSPVRRGRMFSLPKQVPPMTGKTKISKSVSNR